MRQKVNNCYVFFPQRVISVDDKKVSGLFLGSDEVSSIIVEDGFDVIIKAQSEGKLKNNHHDSPSLMVFLNNNFGLSVFFDDNIKVLFCQSQIVGDKIRIIKAARMKEFSSDEQAQLLDYVAKNVGASKEAHERVEVDIDGDVRHVSYLDDFEVDGFFSASVTPYLEISSDLSMKITERTFSMVFLDITSGIVCKERYEIQQESAVNLASESAEEKSVKVSGLEAYFKKKSR